MNPYLWAALYLCCLLVILAIFTNVKRRERAAGARPAKWGHFR
jgi:hypothetical protein